MGLGAGTVQRRVDRLQHADGLLDRTAGFDEMGERAKPVILLVSTRNRELVLRSAEVRSCAVDGVVDGVTVQGARAVKFHGWESRDCVDGTVGVMALKFRFMNQLIMVQLIEQLFS